MLWLSDGENTSVETVRRVTEDILSMFQGPDRPVPPGPRVGVKGPLAPDKTQQRYVT